MAALEQAIREELSDEAADRYRSGPWGMPDGASLADLLSSAGFRDVLVDKHGLIAVFPGGAAQLATSLAASGIAEQITNLPAENLAALRQRINHHLEPLAVGNEVHAVLHSNIATAVKPT